MPNIATLVITFVLLGACAPVRQVSSDVAPGQHGTNSHMSIAAGELRFSPEKPRPGQRVSVTYIPQRHGALGRHLSLRARVRTPDGIDDSDGMGSRTLAVLERRGEGRYLGSFVLPPNVVYAALAVEDVEATWSDTRYGRFWEVLAHEADDRPAFAALEQRFNDHMGRDRLTALHTAREMTRAYPDHVQSWSTLAQAERWALGGDSVAKLTADHRERLHAFDREFAVVDRLPADEVGHLFAYASNLGEREVAQRWRSRLIAEHPDHFFAVQERVFELSGTHREDPTRLLARLDTLWATATGVRSRLILYVFGSEAAASARDSAAMLRWADRHSEENSFTRAAAATSLANVDVLREEGIRRLRSEIAFLEAAPDEERPLGSTREEHHGASAREAARLRVSLASTLFAAGREIDGRAALEEAVAATWNAGWFRQLGEARLAAGDHEGAARAFAAAAADPGTPAAMGDSLRLRLNVPEREWQESVDRARAEIIRRTLQAAQSGDAVDAPGTDRDGNPVQLVELLGDVATVIVVWSPYCPYSNAAMPGIIALGEALTGMEVPLVGVTRTSRDEAERYLKKGSWSLQVVYDTGGEIAGALKSPGTPRFIVIDGGGRVRFTGSRRDDVLRQVVALQAERIEAGSSASSRR